MQNAECRVQNAECTRCGIPHKMRPTGWRHLNASHARLPNFDGTFFFYSDLYRLPDTLAGREVFVFTDGEDVFVRPMRDDNLDGPAIRVERVTPDNHD